MMKIAKILEVVMFGVFLMGVAVIAEEITLTTYYPAPYGAYNELSTTSNTYLATDATGKVGVGTSNPDNKLDVAGGVVIGANFIALDPAVVAPTNGMLIQGNVAIGTAVPAIGVELDVDGTINATAYSVNVGGVATVGYNGSFTDGAGRTVTVTNGIITGVI